MKYKGAYAVLALTVALICGSILTGCGDEDNSETTGTLQFRANGEDFVRQGFVSKDGWRIDFEHVYITLSNITAYQTDPPYDAHEGGSEFKAKVSIPLAGSHTIDLAEGGENADPIPVGSVEVEAGHYNAISWKMARAASGTASGYSLMMIGTAEKDGRTENFSITFDDVCSYTCGEYVGDTRKGIVPTNGTADLEMTFHFDHLFGDIETPADDELNLGALGFEALFAMPDGGDPDMDMAQIHLGHVGEGHCHCECQ